MTQTNNDPIRNINPTLLNKAHQTLSNMVKFFRSWRPQPLGENALLRTQFPYPLSDLPEQTDALSILLHIEAYISLLFQVELIPNITRILGSEKSVRLNREEISYLKEISLKGIDFSIQNLNLVIDYVKIQPDRGLNDIAYHLKDLAQTCGDYVLKYFELGRNPIDDKIGAQLVLRFRVWLSQHNRYILNIRDRLDTIIPISETKPGNAADEPNDLINLCVALTRFRVSRATLKRAIAEKKIHSYRKSKAKNAPHIVSTSELEKWYPRNK